MEKKITIIGANIENTCAKCYWGLLCNPKLTTCNKYEQKPNEVYFGGQECPDFKQYKNGDLDWLYDAIKKYKK